MLFILFFVLSIVCGLLTFALACTLIGFILALAFRPMIRKD